MGAVNFRVDEINDDAVAMAEASLSRVDTQSMSLEKKQQIIRGVRNLVDVLQGNSPAGVIQEQYNSVVEMLKTVPNQDLHQFADLLKGLRSLGKKYGRDIG